MGRRCAVRENAQRQGFCPSTSALHRPYSRPVKILLCEDEPKMAALIKRVLTSERHVVDLVPDGLSALALGVSGEYDVAIVDRMLPDLDGLAVVRGLRAKGVKTPILVLTALGSIDHRVAGLDAGADDYLPKPFAFAELLARIRALARREGSSTAVALAAGDLELDETRHVARVGERAVELSAREFALLGYLIRNAGQVLTRRQILDAVWGAEPDVYSNVVDLYVHYLRRKLEELGRADRLQTVRGVGYVLRQGTDPRPAVAPPADA
jgi:two-component system, OmpR family, response regulator